MLTNQNLSRLLGDVVISEFSIPVIEPWEGHLHGVGVQSHCKICNAKKHGGV